MQQVGEGIMFLSLQVNCVISPIIFFWSAQLTPLLNILQKQIIEHATETDYRICHRNILALKLRSH